MSRRLALTLCCLVALVDLALIHHALPRAQFGDEWRYLYYAENLWHGYYSPPERLFLSNGPGYPILLMPFVKLGWSDGARYLNAFLHAGAIFYAWLIVRARFSRGLALAALAGLALYVPLFSHLPLLYTEVLCFFLVTAWIHHALAGHTVAAGLILGYLCLTKVVFGAVLLGFLIVMLLLRRRASVKQALLAFALCLPYLVYTHHLTGKFFYWSSLWPNSFYWLTSPYEGEWGDWYHQGWVEDNATLRAHHKQVYDRATGLALIPNLPTSVQVFNLTTPEADAIFLAEAKRNVREHPAKFALNWCANLVRLFCDVPTSVRGTPRVNEYSVANVPLFAWLCFVAGFAWRRRVRPPPEWHPIALFALLAIGAYSLSSAVSRFLIPIAPMLWLWSCAWLTAVRAAPPRTRPTSAP